MSRLLYAVIFAVGIGFVGSAYSDAAWERLNARWTFTRDWIVCHETKLDNPDFKAYTFDDRPREVFTAFTYYCERGDHTLFLWTDDDDDLRDVRCHRKTTSCNGWSSQARGVWGRCQDGHSFLLQWGRR